MIWDGGEYHLTQLEDAVREITNDVNSGGTFDMKKLKKASRTLSRLIEDMED